MAAQIDTTAGVRVVSRRVVLERFTPLLGGDYDVHPDGETFVVVRPLKGAPGDHLVVVLDAFGELERLAGGPR